MKQLHKNSGLLIYCSREIFRLFNLKVDYDHYHSLPYQLHFEVKIQIYLIYTKLSCFRIKKLNAHRQTWANIDNQAILSIQIHYQSLYIFSHSLFRFNL